MTEPTRGAQRWELMFTRQAEKTLRQIPPELLQPIDRAILALAENPYPPAGQKLPGQANLYRLHVAQWRIAYAVEEQRLTVLILEIALRHRPARYQVEMDSDVEDKIDLEPWDELSPSDLDNESPAKPEIHNKALEAIINQISLNQIYNKALKNFSEITNLTELGEFLAASPKQPPAEQAEPLDQGDAGALPKIRLLIIGDSAQAREHLRDLLASEPAIDIVGESPSMAEAFPLVLRLQPDIVLRWLSLPGETTSDEIQMIHVQHGAEYPGATRVLWNKEVLKQPFISRAELISTIRRVYLVNTAEADTPSRYKFAAAQQLRVAKLGQCVEISLSVANLAESLSFYETLGLKRVDGGETPYPWAIVSDGVLHLGLHQQIFLSPTLSYFDAQIRPAHTGTAFRINLLRNLGLKLDPVVKSGVKLSLGDHGYAKATAFETPQGQRIMLADMPADPQVSVEKFPLPVRNFFSKCMAFGELTLKTENVQEVVTYWQQLGFKQIASGQIPYPWATVSDGLIRLGFHQAARLTQPAIAYFVPDLPERLARLHEQGSGLISEYKDAQGNHLGAVLQSPDGQRFILFSGDMKATENGAEAAPEEHSPESRLQTGAATQPHSEEIRWCIVFCHQGYEQKVRENLLHRIKAMGLKNKIFQVIVPLDDAGEASMAPSYIFVKMIIDEDTWDVVKNSPGVNGFFGLGDQPATFNTAEIDYLLKRIGAKPLKQEAGFREGQQVHIIDGPFADFIGLVYAVDEARARLNVEINFFNRKMPVELDFSQVENIVS